MKIGLLQLFVRDALHKGQVFLVFQKADGTKREMHASLHSEILEGIFSEEEINEEAVDNSNEFYQRVVDVEINEWRAFSWDRLESVNGILVESL